MTTMTRNFLFGGLALLAVGVAVGGVAYLSSVGTGGQELAATAELAVVPEEASLVAFADLRTILASDVHQQVRRAMPDAGSSADSGRAQFESETGIDVDRDVDRVLAYLMASPDRAAGARGLPGEGLVLLQGRFDLTRLERAATERGAVADTYEGVRFFRYADDDPHRGDPAGPVADERSLVVAFFGPSLLAAGSDGAFRRTVDLRNGRGAGVGDDSDLRRLVDRVWDPARGDEPATWAVGRADALLDQVPLPSEAVTQLPPLTAFAVGAYVNGGVDGRLQVETRDAEGAQQLQDVVRGFVALAKMQAGRMPQFDPVIQSLQLRLLEETVLELRFELPVDVLMNMAPGRSPVAGDTDTQDLQ